MIRLFAYGSLLDPHVQLKLWGHTKSGPVAEVPGLHISYAEDFPRLTRAPVFGVAAVGRVLELTSDEFAEACVYEGVLYSVQTVVLADLTEAVAFL